MQIKQEHIMEEEIKEKEISGETSSLKIVANNSPRGDDPDWLKYLKQGTEFLCRPKSNQYQLPFLGEYHIVSTGAYKAICLFDVTANREVWVDSGRFSRDHALYEILTEGTDE